MQQPNNKFFSTGWPYLLLLLIAGILLYPVIFTKEGSFCINPDNLHQAYPFLNKLASSLHKGYLPVWDANIYGGKNFAGEFQTGIFYPLNVAWCLLFGSVKGIDVYWLDLLVALHYLICLLGMYRVGRVFRLPPAAAVVSALTFTFTGAVAARAGAQTCIFYGLALLPWVIYFLGKYYMDGRRKKWLIFSGLVAGLEILAGHMQPFFHTLLISGIIIIFYEFSERKSWIQFFLSTAANGLLIGFFALLIALPQLYYSMEYMSRAYRWVEAEFPLAPGEAVPFKVYAYKFMIHLSELPNFLSPQFTPPSDDNALYMGILPLCLFVIFLLLYRSLAIIRAHASLARLLLIILVVGTLSVLGYQTFFVHILYGIQYLNAVRELGRYVILISFSASLLVGLAITYLPAIKDRLFKQSGVVKISVLTALSVNMLYLIFFQRDHISAHVTIPFLLGFLFLLVLTVVKKTAYIPVLAIAFICVDLYLNPVSYASTQTATYPARYFARTRLIDSLESSCGKYRVFTYIQNPNLDLPNIGDIYSIQTKFGYGATMNREYLFFVRTDWAMNSEVNDLLNIKYILTDQVLDSNFIFKDSVGHLSLYERKNCYPRVYWKRQLGRSDIEAENRGNIRPLVYTDLYQKMEVDCREADTLILSENFYPGWVCYDNGRKTAIYPATIKNYPPIFRSIALGAGRHVVEFKYNKVFYWF